MEQKNKPTSKKTATSLRDDRLKAALKANLARRKAQTRARATQNTAPDADSNKE